MTSTIDLLKAIIEIEGYPQFEDIVPRLKEELKGRYENRQITMPKKGLPYKNIDGVKYYPTGKVSHITRTYYQGIEISSFLEPYEAPERQERKKKKSATTKTYKDKLRVLPFFYRMLCYKQLGLRITRKKLYDAKGCADFEAQEALIKKNCDGQIKNDLLIRLYQDAPIGQSISKILDGLFDPHNYTLKTGHRRSEEEWPHRGIHRLLFIEKCEGRIHYNDYADAADTERTYKEILGKNKFALQILLPTKETIQLLVNESLSRGGEIVVNQPMVWVKFDNIPELITQVKALAKINPNVTEVLKRAGFDD